jgi:hypothetical protein
MRNLLAFLAAAVLTFLGVGWYLDWYHVKSSPADVGHHRVDIDINGDKIIKDVETGVQKGEQKLQNALEKDKKPATAPTAAVRETTLKK